MPQFQIYPLGNIYNDERKEFTLAKDQRLVTVVSLSPHHAHAVVEMRKEESHGDVERK